MLVRLIAIVFLLLAAVPAGADTAASDWVGSTESRARLIAATTAVGGQERLRFGLEIDLQEGWKTYWRSPGEGGYPPRLEWQGSSNLAQTEIAWPAPTRFEILGIDSVGYEERVIYPIAVTPERAGEAVTARLSLDYLTCKDVCIPQRADLTLTLPAGPARPSGHAFDLDKARGQVPGPAVADFTISSASVRPGDGERWWLELETGSPLQNPDAFVETSGEAFAFGAPERLGPTRMRLPVLYAETGPAALAGEEITVTLTDGARALEQTVTASIAAGSGGSGTAAWALMLLTALAGGLILNLMPCVLPVLSIKVLAVIKHGGGAPAAVRTSFLATAAGILVSFGLLAAGAIALREAGIAVGWGIQFQEPLFIAFMALICVLFAANLWGLFEVPMPAAVNRLGEGQAGAFATGMFATLLATPCSAPFVGTAIAFALGHGWVETVAIFLAMGLGLALPYLTIALRPRIATALPKPGRWMLRLRVLLGFALIATALWLGSVLLSLSGEVPAAALAALCVALLIWLWQAAARWRLPGAVAVIVAGLTLPAALPSANPSGQEALAGVWQPFSQQRLANLVADGETVLIDVTADWCITCQVNKAAVLNRGEVAARLTDGDVVALRADWTRPDPAIQSYLASFGRYGIPFNAVYGPKAPGGIALPELLRESTVLSAIEAASE